MNSPPGSPSTFGAAPDNFVFEAQALTRQFDDGQVHALRGVDFQIASGEFVSIVGPSGSGKSTLLQLLATLDRPTTGSLKYRGKSLTDFANPAVFRAREIGFVFQAFHLLPTFTAAENVQMPMFETDCLRAERRARASELLTSVGLGHRLNHLPAKLSGGERQRVAIARSLANEPSVLLADEPTGNLDSRNADEILELLTQLHANRRMTLILVTHDSGIAQRASRTIEMKDGRIVYDGRAADHRLRVT